MLVTSSHFATFFLGLETLSISLYALIAYTRRQKERVEAGLKYLILAGATAAFLLFGMALIYAELGTMSLAGIAGMAPAASGSPVFLAGGVLLVVGIAFKLALAPFHLWTPDVYQGAPAPVTGFIATISKGAMFVLLLRYFYDLGLLENAGTVAVFTFIAVASMLAGNLLALRQDNIKRLLAYSSIAHLGYLLIPFIAFNALSLEAVALYLVVYFLTSLCAFGAVAHLSRPQAEREQLRDYQGLFWQRPYLSLILMLALLSLAGLPPLAGLVGKVYLVTAGLDSQLWLLLATLVIGSLIGVYYYLRVMVVMVRQPGEGQGAEPNKAEPKMAEPKMAEPTVAKPVLATPSGLLLAVLALTMVIIGLYPTPLIRLITAVLPSLP